MRPIATPPTCYDLKLIAKHLELSPTALSPERTKL